jgi:hypothetical protein
VTYGTHYFLGCDGPGGRRLDDGRFYLEGMMVVNQIQGARLLVLRSMLELELKGMRRSRPPSAYMIIKKELGLSGSRERVLAQMDEIRNELLGLKDEANA